MKQTNLEWLNNLDGREKRVRTFDMQYAEFRNSPGGDNYNSVDRMLYWLASPHIEPITLTAEERKAAELAVAIGLPWITRINNETVLSEERLNSSIGVKACYVPAFHSLCDFGGNAHPEWITAEPIDLRTLLIKEESK